MNNWYRYIFIIGLIATFTTSNALAQKAKKKTTRIRVEYFKNNNKTESLVATLRVKEERYVPLTDVLVRFYSINDTSNVILDKIRTNEQGEAILIIEGSPKIFKDSLGLMNFEVEYIGNTSTKGSKRKISVKQANLDVSFFKKDTIKYIEIEANEIGQNGLPQPLKNIDIMLYIKGTFSLLNFANQETDENGRVKVEFPIDMPGDAVGVLTIVAKIEDAKNYGTIESRGNINWGIPVPVVKEKQRGLGDTDAPLWMVYTLIILLSAVWLHYLYVIFLIIKIKLVKTIF